MLPRCPLLPVEIWGLIMSGRCPDVTAGDWSGLSRWEKWRGVSREEAIGAFAEVTAAPVRHIQQCASPSHSAAQLEGRRVGDAGIDAGLLPCQSDWDGIDIHAAKPVAVSMASRMLLPS